MGQLFGEFYVNWWKNYIMKVKFLIYLCGILAIAQYALEYLGIDTSNNANSAIVTEIDTLNNASTVPTYVPGTWNNVGTDMNGQIRWTYTRADGTQVYRQRIIDSDGSIYYIDGSGYMSRNYTDQDGIKYGNDGKAINIYSLDEKMKSYLERFDSGEKNIVFDSVEEISKFQRCYIGYKSDYSFNGIQYMTSGKDGTIYLDDSVVPDDKSEAVEQFVSTYTPLCGGSTIEETARSAAKIVGDTWNYDYEMLNMPNFSSLNNAVKRNAGICQDYARMTVRILERKGIKAEPVSGIANARQEDGSYVWGPHMWVRVNINQGHEGMPEQWMYIDPTWYSCTKDTRYLDIDYNEYLNTYIMNAN